jgi:hypothetical protein
MRVLNKVAGLSLASERLLEVISDSVSPDTLKRGVEKCTPTEAQKGLTAKRMEQESRNME